MFIYGKSYWWIDYLSPINWKTDYARRLSSCMQINRQGTTPPTKFCTLCKFDGIIDITARSETISRKAVCHWSNILNYDYTESVDRCTIKSKLMLLILTILFFISIVYWRTKYSKANEFYVTRERSRNWNFDFRIWNWYRKQAISINF